jgi:hypothetical protein
VSKVIEPKIVQPGLTYSDMRLFVTSVLAEEPWKYDSKVIPMPWRHEEVDIINAKLGSGGLTLGYYNCDGNVSCSTLPKKCHVVDGVRYCLTHLFSEVSRPLSPRCRRLDIPSLNGSHTSMTSP